MIKSKTIAYQCMQQWRKKLLAYSGPNLSAKQEHLDMLENIEAYIKDLERALRDKQFFHSLQEMPSQPQQSAVARLQKEVSDLKQLLRMRGIQEHDLPFLYADMKEILRSNAISNARTCWPELF